MHWRAQMVVLNLGHDGVPRGLSPFCSQLSRYLRVAMMMPFICSYRNKKAQLSSFLRVACGRQKVSWWPIGASIVATSIPASRRLRVTVGAAWTGELQKQQIVVNFQGCVFKFVTVFIQVNERICRAKRRGCRNGRWGSGAGRRMGGEGEGSRRRLAGGGAS